MDKHYAGWQQQSISPHTSQVVIAALVDSLKVEYVPLQERASGALATLSSRCCDV